MKKWFGYGAGSNVLLVLVAFLMVAACRKSNPNVMRTNNPSSDSPSVDGTAITYLALGDSYTIGQSVAEKERFPHLTAKLLRSQGINIQEPDYIATTGWTTAELQSAIATKPTLGTYDIVTLLIGVNDQYRHLDTAGYRSRFTQLLEKAIALTGNHKERVFVLSIPDYSATSFVGQQDKMNVSKEIDDFNRINKEITLAHKIAYIDITPLTRQAATDPTLLANDNLHYSGKEHQQWAELLAPVIMKSL